MEKLSVLPFINSIIFTNNPITSIKDYRKTIFSIFRVSIKDSAHGFFLDNILATPYEQVQVIKAVESTKDELIKNAII